MDIKILEVRDSGTCISLLCIDMNAPANPAQRAHLRRLGYPLDGHPNIAIAHLEADGSPFQNDPWYWGGNGTMKPAHQYIIRNWTRLKDGDVVCTETIRGERSTPKEPEVWTGN